MKSFKFLSMFKILLPLIFSRIFFQKVFAFWLLFVVGYILRDFLALFLITFVFSYLFLEMGTVFAGKLHDWWLHGKKTRARKIVAEYATTNIVVTFLYIAFIILLTFIFANIIPRIWIEIEKLATSAPRLADAGRELIMNIESNIGINLGAEEMFANIISTSNIEHIGQSALLYIRDAGAILLKFMMGLVLSYIFIIERNQVSSFFKLLQTGNFAFLYREYRIIAGKIWNGFWLIFKAQSIIALTNAILTSVCLSIIGFFIPTGNFPYIFTLSLIVFILGFIPIFGTLISSVPIILIGYGAWWVSAVIGIVIMVSVIHAVEAYILNPKIVSSYIHFPVFITFLILIISEHLFGLVWLLVWVPMFSILLSLFEDFDTYISEIRKKIHG